MHGQGHAPMVKHVYFPTHATNVEKNISLGNALENKHLRNHKLHLPQNQSTLPSPLINRQTLELLLSGYHDKHFVIEGFLHGFKLHYTGQCISSFLNNHASAERNVNILQQKINHEIHLGRVAGPFNAPPFHPFIVSPLGLVPKKEPDTYRIIHDLSAPKGYSVNEHIADEFVTVSYEIFDYVISLIQSIGYGCLMAKADIKDAFRLLPISPEDYKLLGFCVNGKYYYDKYLPMGCRTSCQAFTRFGGALHWILITLYNVLSVSHILDDFQFFGPSGTHACMHGLSSFRHLCHQLNVPIKESKTVYPSTKVILHGIEVDTIAMTMCLPVEKLDKLNTMLNSYLKLFKVTLRQLQQLLGLMNFACKCVVPGRAFMRRLINLTIGLKQPHHHVRVNKEAKQDLQVWVHFLQQYNGKTIILDSQWFTSQTLHFYTDAAASKGFSCVFWRVACRLER